MVYVPHDTTREVAEMQRDIINAMTARERAEMLNSLCNAVTDVAKAGIRWKHPEATEADVAIRLMARRYGQPFVHAIPATEIERIRAAQSE